VWEDAAKTKQVNTAEVFARFNEATQHQLIISAFRLLEALHAVRMSQASDGVTEHLFNMGAFAGTGHELFILLTEHYRLSGPKMEYVKFLHFMQVTCDSSFVSPNFHKTND